MTHRLSQPILLVSLAGLMASCVPEPGLNGADFAEPGAATGPCFEADLSDGLQDGDEALIVFACFNEHGALDELEPMVQYLATSEDVESFVEAANETLETFDVVGGLEIAARLLSAEDAPVSRAADLLVESVDAGLLGPGIGLAREAADAVTACEARDDRGECSVPRLTLHLLDTETPDDLGAILDAVEARTTREQREAMLDAGAALLWATSTANEEKLAAGNDVVNLGRLLVDVPAGEEASPLERMLPYVAMLLDDDVDGDGDADVNPDDDNPLAAIARPLAALWRDEDRSGKNTFDHIPDELVAVFTTNSEGDEVGWEGTNVLDELLVATEDLTSDLSLLSTELTLPGESEPSTLLEILLDLLDGVYLSGADPEDLVGDLNDMMGAICTDDSSIAICDLTKDALPPLEALVELTPNTTKVVLAVVYALHQTVDVAGLLPLVEIVLELDLIDETRGLLVETLRADAIAPMLPLIPVFIDTELGRLAPAGQAAQELGNLLVNEQDFDGDGDRVVPALVPLPLMRQVLRPEFPTASLDGTLAVLGERMQDPESGLYPENLLDLVDGLGEALGQQQVDLEAQARKLLENEALWTAGARLLADPALADLLAPVEGRSGAVWYAYDLIESGTLDEMLSLMASVLDLLVDYGLIDPGLDEGDSTARTRAPLAGTASLPAPPAAAEAP